MTDIFEEKFKEYNKNGMQITCVRDLENIACYAGEDVAESVLKEFPEFPYGTEYEGKHPFHKLFYDCCCKKLDKTKLPSSSHYKRIYKEEFLRGVDGVWGDHICCTYYSM